MLIVGKNKTLLLEQLPSTFLFIDDGELIDQLTFPKRRRVTYLDLQKHALNPLKDINYQRAVAFTEILKSAFPGGANTLTKETFEHQLLEALDAKPRNLATLIPNTKETLYSYQKIQRLLLSPVLKNFLTRPTNFSFTGILIARLNRAELGDFDCFILANLLINNYKGHVVIPDYGTYACPFHLSLIRQNRLTAGVHFLSELPENLRNAFLLGETLPSQCTFEDANTLANSAGIAGTSVGHSDFVYAAMR